MRVVALDTETELITPTCKVPRLVCVSAFDGDQTTLLSYSEAKQFVFENLTRAAGGKTKIVGHNVAYDMAVLARQWGELLPIIFEAYDANMIEDTMVREMLAKIKRGKHLSGLSLAALYKQYGFGELEKKKGGPRTTYGALRGVPLEYWPNEAIEYAEKDAVATLQVWRAQDDFPDEHAQVQAAWALHLMGARGMATDPEFTANKRAELEEEQQGCWDRIVEEGHLIHPVKGKITNDLLRDVIEQACEQLGQTPERTKTGAISYSKDAVERLNHPALKDYTRYKQIEKLLNTYIKAIESASSIHPSFNVLVQSGRTSCRQPNLQNLPRGGDIRGCFIPRPGYHLALADYSAAEMRGLGQVMLDLDMESPMALAMNVPDADPHIVLGADLLGLNEGEMRARMEAKDPDAKAARQAAKAANFGFPGGMGANTFVLAQRAMGADYNVRFAKRLQKAYINKWNMRPYFDYISKVVDKYGYIIQHRSGRVRGGIRFTDGCNTLFQGIVADGAKRACYQAVRTSLVNEHSPLYGSYIVNFLHDELIAEVPEDAGHEAAMALKEIMEESMNEYTPDVPSIAEPALADRWYKDIKPRFEKGRLTLWQPE